MAEEQLPPSSPFMPGANKTLYMCFEGLGYPPKSYAIRSVKADELFTSSSSSPPPLEDVFHMEDHSFCLGMRCGKLGSKIYFIGGQIPQYMDPDNTLTIDGEEIPLFPPYSSFDYSSSVFVFDTAATRSLDTSSVTPLHSGKPCPLVVDVEGKLYVLSGIPVRGIRQPAFEAYDSVTNSWEKLSCPPFLDPECKYFQIPKYTGYAVIGKKIHVTTARSSFSYDIKDDTWVPCSLFDGVPGELHQPWEDPIFPYEWDYYASRNDQTPCGPPFGFQGQAVLFGDDVLICLDPSELEIVAHRFGQGFFCLVIMLMQHYDTPPDYKSKYTISLVPFMVKSSATELKDHFLITAVGERFSYTYELEIPLVEKILRSIGCFAT
uniref:Uncharacterized protein n=1 Tax=Davidia involucrata TaxID=16924 RepID=A0A5B7BX24_DAVIN